MKKTFVDAINELYNRKIDLLNQLDECECSITNIMYEQLAYTEKFVNAIIDWVLLLPQEALAYYEASKKKLSMNGTCKILTVNSSGDLTYGEDINPNLLFMNKEINIELNIDNERLYERFKHVCGMEPDEYESITVTRAWIREWFTDNTGYPHDITVGVEGIQELIPLAVVSNSINRTGWESTLEITQYPIKCERVVEIIEEYFHISL